MEIADMDPYNFIEIIDLNNRSVHRQRIMNTTTSHGYEKLIIFNATCVRWDGDIYISGGKRVERYGTSTTITDQTHVMRYNIQDGALHKVTSAQVGPNEMTSQGACAQDSSRIFYVPQEVPGIFMWTPMPPPDNSWQFSYLCDLPTALTDDPQLFVYADVLIIVARQGTGVFPIPALSSSFPFTLYPNQFSSTDGSTKLLDVYGSTIVGGPVWDGVPTHPPVLVLYRLGGTALALKSTPSRDPANTPEEVPFLHMLEAKTTVRLPIPFNLTGLGQTRDLADWVLNGVGLTASPIPAQSDALGIDASCREHFSGNETMQCKIALANNPQCNCSQSSAFETPWRDTNTTVSLQHLETLVTSTAQHIWLCFKRSNSEVYYRINPAFPYVLSYDPQPPNSDGAPASQTIVEIVFLSIGGAVISVMIILAVKKIASRRRFVDDGRR